MGLISIKMPSTRTLTIILIVISLLASAGIYQSLKRIREIQDFNQAVLAGKVPVTDTQSFEAKFATAYWLAKKERFKEASLLFSHLLTHASVKHKAAILHNLGNIYFYRGAAINGTNNEVAQESDYLFRQAKNEYQQAIRLDNSDWGTRYNLDRLILMLPGTPVPGVGDSDSPGLIMGNIPVGLP
jgi:mxaK protein